MNNCKFNRRFEGGNKYYYEFIEKKNIYNEIDTVSLDSFSNFSCRFQNPNYFFQFELEMF